MGLYLGKDPVTGEGAPTVLDYHLHPDIEIKPPRGAKARTLAITQICLHWTGGEGDITQLSRTLRQRRVGAHFFIDRWGTIWQMADPMRVATYHAGRIVNARSIGIEVACYGYRWPARNRWNWRKVPKVARDRIIYETRISGRRYFLADYYGVQTEAMVSLVECLIRELPDIERTVPLEDDGSLRTRRFSLKEARSYSGVLGHMHVPLTGKIDPGTRPLQALRRRWKEI